MNVESFLDELATRSKESFDAHQRLMSFDEFVEDVLAHPRQRLRDAACYLADMLESFGSSEVELPAGPVRRFKLFDGLADGTEQAVFGQERVQQKLYELVRGFADRGRIDKMILLHGPNGSAKSSLVEALMRGLEAYSHTDEGALYRINWIFSEKYERTNLGFTTEPDAELPYNSFAYVDALDINARLRCELKENPFLVIPRAHRAELLATSALSEAERKRLLTRTFVGHGELCPMCAEIYKSLMLAHHGDFRKLVRHIQIERVYVSKRYRLGAVTIEPQRNVDAGARLLRFDRGTAPTMLQDAQLIQPEGDLVAANGGLVEYSDFFKRPLETNKYLLTTSEKGTISLPGMVAYLNLVLLATSNEKHLSFFKRDPDFGSFKGRMELVEVPYLLRFSEEARIYERSMESVAGGKHIAPHVGEIAALWAVLTRLRRPKLKNHPSAFGPVIGKLNPLQKAYLYDRGETPEDWKDDERKELLARLKEIRAEFDDALEEFEGILDGAYEGRHGASPREVLTILAAAAQRKGFHCLSPLAVIATLREFIREVSVFDFLRLPHENGYFDHEHLIVLLERDYLGRVAEEVQDAVGLVDESEYQRLFDDYFVQVRAYVTREKILNDKTGKLEDVNEKLLERVEEILSIREEPAIFRRNLLSRIAAWTVENRGKPARLEPATLFADIFKAIKRNFFQAREKQLHAIEEQILTWGSAEFRGLTPSAQKTVETSIDTMRRRYGYCEHCTKEVLAFSLSRQRQRLEKEGR